VGQSGLLATSRGCIGAAARQQRRGCGRGIGFHDDDDDDDLVVVVVVVVVAVVVDEEETGYLRVMVRDGSFNVRSSSGLEERTRCPPAHRDVHAVPDGRAPPPVLPIPDYPLPPSSLGWKIWPTLPLNLFLPLSRNRK
jgi:hypothetical protein